MPLHRLLLLLLLPLVLACPAQARKLPATVTAVVDGDTVWVRTRQGGAPFPVRVQGVDAPELCQRWGAQARDALARRVLHQRVTLDTRGRDDYDRLLARLDGAGGHDVGGWLVAQGLAWSSRFHGRAGPYAAQEAQARQARRGLWSDTQPLEPRRFRQLHGRCPRPAR